MRSIGKGLARGQEDVSVLIGEGLPPGRTVVDDRMRAASRRAGGRLGRGGIVGALALAIIVVAACGAPPAPSGPAQPPTPVGAEFFSGPNSIWRTPVPANAPADPRSADYVKLLSTLDPVVALRNFTAPIYRADASAPKYRIAPTAPYATPEAVLRDVPIPDHAFPDPAGDGHIAILDTTSSCVFEMYRAQRGPDGWTADWINGTPADGDGIYPDGLSTRASGISITAGLIWPEELRAGKIDHALVFAYPFTREGDAVEPATRSDGRSRDPAALPLGAHLVLDPTLDLSTLELTPAELTIAEALQRYGMILADSGGGLSLFAVHPQSYSADPYSAIWGPEIFASVGGIPMDRMKVLPFGKPHPSYKGPVTPNRCTDEARD
jgi:hypothetical protein